ncbi:het domain protein [Seiridium cupressi]
MHLLHLDSNDGLTWTENLIHDLPSYAILSHTWASDGEEVAYQDLLGKSGKDKAGCKKILFCGQQARRDGLNYFWYRDAKRCYVYLADVLKVDKDAQADELTEVGRIQTSASTQQGQKAYAYFNERSQFCHQTAGIIGKQKVSSQAVEYRSGFSGCTQLQVREMVLHALKMKFGPCLDEGEV